jgi:hypothetical protein
VSSAPIFSFDLIAYVERKYSITIPGADIAAKVAWLKANINANYVNGMDSEALLQVVKHPRHVWDVSASTWIVFATNVTSVVISTNMEWDKRNILTSGLMPTDSCTS